MKNFQKHAIVYYIVYCITVPIAATTIASAAPTAVTTNMNPSPGTDLQPRHVCQIVRLADYYSTCLLPILPISLDPHYAYCCPACCPYFIGRVHGLTKLPLKDTCS